MIPPYLSNNRIDSNTIALNDMKTLSLRGISRQDNDWFLIDVVRTELGEPLCPPCLYWFGGATTGF